MAKISVETKACIGLPVTCGKKTSGLVVFSPGGEILTFLLSDTAYDKGYNDVPLMTEDPVEITAKQYDKFLGKSNNTRIEKF